MSTVTVELDLPEDWQTFKLPPALHDRLQELLDRQLEDPERVGEVEPEAEDHLEQLHPATVPVVGPHAEGRVVLRQGPGRDDDPALPASAREAPADPEDLRSGQGPA